MGKARTLRSMRMDATGNSINEPDGVCNRTASAFASLIAAASVVGTQVRPSATPISSPTDRANASSVRFADSMRPSVSLRVFSAAMAVTDRPAGKTPGPVFGAAEPAPLAKPSDELLLQKLVALEQRIKVLEAQVEMQDGTVDSGGPIRFFNLHDRGTV